MSFIKYIFTSITCPHHPFLAEAELVTARHELEMRDMDRRLREEQDLEFQRTMEADRKRIEEENKKKQEEEDKIRAAEEKANERIRRVTEHRVGNFTRFQPEFQQFFSEFYPIPVPFYSFSHGFNSFLYLFPPKYLKT